MVGIPAVLAGLHASQANYRWWWPTNWMAVPAAIIAIGLVLVVLPIRRARAAGATSATDSADWIVSCDETGDRLTLVFVLRHRFDNLGAIRAFGAFRCTVTDPGGVTTTATGLALFYQYPRDFPGAPPMRSGVYQCVWEGQDAKGAWQEIIRSTYQADLPKLIVTIMQNDFENWKHLALIAALRVKITNTTDVMIRLRAIGFMHDPEGIPGWRTSVSTQERLEVDRELHARKERQHYGIPLRNHATVPGRESISGWIIEAVTRNPAGGSPQCTVVVEDVLGDKYLATLDKHEPNTSG